MGAIWSGLPLWILIAPTLLMLCNAALHALRVHLLLEAHHHQISYLTVLSAMLKGNFVGITLPSGGSELAKMAWLSKPCGGLDKATAIIVLARMLELFPWGAVILCGVLFGLAEYSTELWIAGGFFGLAFWTVGLVFFGLCWHWWSPPFRLPDWLSKVLVAARQHSIQRRTLGLVMLLALPFVLVNAGTVWLILQAFSVPISYGVVVTIFPTADAVISLPISINGIGVREVIFSHVLPSVGITGEVSVAIAWTRWTGELGRATAGGILFLCGSSSEGLS